MINNTIGIVTVTVGDIRYRGSYRIQGEDFLVTAYGLVGARMSASLVADGSQKVVLNLAKLMLTNMVKQQSDTPGTDLTLSMQGATSTVCY